MKVPLLKTRAIASCEAVGSLDRMPMPGIPLRQPAISASPAEDVGGSGSEEGRSP
jgi:hypothetical protein